MTHGGTDDDRSGLHSTPHAAMARPHLGFTLVELLVVIAIIAVLVGLLLPAVHSARESARVAQCKGNLRQIAQGCLQHESAHGFFPAMGRDDVDRGTGNPDKGFASLQPGGWMYNILPYIEQSSLHQLGAGASDKSATQDTRAATVVSIYLCPTRGGGMVRSDFLNLTEVARSDYGGCTDTGDGIFPTNSTDTNNGMVRSLSVADGLGNVFLCGERSLNPLRYQQALNPTYGANLRGWTAGVNQSTLCRVTAHADLNIHVPFRDTPGLESTNANSWPARKVGIAFGGPHTTLQMAFADGSVRSLSFKTAPAVFERLGKIGDGGGLDLIGQ